MITKKQTLITIIVSSIFSLLFLFFASGNMYVDIDNNSGSSPGCYIPEGCPDMGSSQGYGVPFVFKNDTNGFAGPQTEIYLDKATYNFLIYFGVTFSFVTVIYLIKNKIKKH